MDNVQDNIYIIVFYMLKSEGIPVRGRETSRLPHFLDNRLTDGGEVVSHTLRLPVTPQEDSWDSFLLEAESTAGP
jgi:hypothetical protein